MHAVYQDVLLETVAGPVRLYLQGRKDTVRCIVASLTDETSGDLYEELRRQASGEHDRPHVTHEVSPEVGFPFRF